MGIRTIIDKWEHDREGALRELRELEELTSDVCAFIAESIRIIAIDIKKKGPAEIRNDVRALNNILNHLLNNNFFKGEAKRHTLQLINVLEELAQDLEHGMPFERRKERFHLFLDQVNEFIQEFLEDADLKIARIHELVEKL